MYAASTQQRVGPLPVVHEAVCQGGAWQPMSCCTYFHTMRLRRRGYHTGRAMQQAPPGRCRGKAAASGFETANVATFGWMLSALLAIHIMQLLTSSSALCVRPGSTDCRSQWQGAHCFSRFGVNTVSIASQHS